MSQGRGGGAGFPQHAFAPAFWQACVRADSEEGAAYGGSSSARASSSTSSTCRPIPPGRCTSATAAARCSATRSPICSLSPATTSRASTTSTMPARRWTRWRAPPILRYREALGEDIGEIPAGLYPGDYLKPVGAALAQEYGHTLLNFPRGALAAAGARASPSRPCWSRSSRIWPRSTCGTTCSSRSAR